MRVKAKECPNCRGTGKMFHAGMTDTWDNQISKDWYTACPECHGKKLVPIEPLVNRELWLEIPD